MQVGSLSEWALFVVITIDSLYYGIQEHREKRQMPKSDLQSTKETSGQFLGVGIGRCYPFCPEHGLDWPCKMCEGGRSVSMSEKPEVGTVWKERDSRFTRYVTILRIEGDKAVVKSSANPSTGYGIRETRIAIKNFGKRYSFWGRNPCLEPSKWALERARPIAAKVFYGDKSDNLGCVSGACKNFKYGSSDWLCELCVLQIKMALEFDAIDKKSQDRFVAAQMAHVKDYPDFGDCRWECTTMGPLLEMLEKVRSRLWPSFRREKESSMKCKCWCRAKDGATILRNCAAHCQCPCHQDARLKAFIPEPSHIEPAPPSEWKKS